MEDIPECFESSENQVQVWSSHCDENANNVLMNYPSCGGETMTLESNTYPSAPNDDGALTGAGLSPFVPPVNGLHVQEDNCPAPINDTLEGQADQQPSMVDVPRGNINITTDTVRSQKICKVCGDNATGYNFNAITCESCKAFFRRNALRNKEFKCPYSEDCEITAISRRFCQRCRLSKCFAIGMKKEWILNDEQLRRRKNSRLNRIKNEQKNKREAEQRQKQTRRSMQMHSNVSKVVPPVDDYHYSLQPISNREENVIERSAGSYTIPGSNISAAENMVLENSITPETRTGDINRRDDTNASSIILPANNCAQNNVPTMNCTPNSFAQFVLPKVPVLSSPSKVYGLNSNDTERLTEVASVFSGLCAALEPKKLKYYSSELERFSSDLSYDLETTMYRLVEMVKSFSPFKQLSRDSKFVLLKDGMVEMVATCALCWRPPSCEKNESQSALGHKETLFNRWYVKMNVENKCRFEKLLQLFHHDICSNTILVSLVLLIVLFSNSKKVINRDESLLIANYQKTYSQLFNTYLEFIHNTAAAQLSKRLPQILNILKDVGENAAGLFLCNGFEKQDSALLGEIFNIP